MSIHFLLYFPVLSSDVCCRNMIEELSDWVITKDLLPPPTAMSDISTYQETLKRAMISKSDVKHLLNYQLNYASLSCVHR